MRDRNSEYTKEIKLLTERKEKHKASQQFVAGIKEEIKLLKQKSMTEKELLDAQIAANTTVKDSSKARALIEERDALLAMIKIADKAQQDKVKNLEKERREKERVLSLQKSQADNLLLQAVSLRDGEKAASALRLQMQGVDAATASGLVNIQDQLKGLDGSSKLINSVGVSGDDQRLLTGVGQQSEDKLLVVANQSAQQDQDRNQLLNDILQKLGNFKQSIEVETVGT